MIWLVTNMRMKNLKLLIDHDFKFTHFRRGTNDIHAFVNDTIQDGSLRSMMRLGGVEIVELFEWNNKLYRDELIKYHIESARAIKHNKPCLPSEPSGSISFNSENQKELTEDFFKSPINMWRTHWFVEDINAG